MGVGGAVVAALLCTIGTDAAAQGGEVTDGKVKPLTPGPATHAHAESNSLSAGSDQVYSSAVSDGVGEVGGSEAAVVVEAVGEEFTQTYSWMVPWTNELLRSGQTSLVTITLFSGQSKQFANTDKKLKNYFYYYHYGFAAGGRENIPHCAETPVRGTSNSTICQTWASDQGQGLHRHADHGL